MLQLSKDYESAFTSLLSGLATSSRRKRWPSLTAFWPMIGADYVVGGGICLVGRAVNGWDDGSVFTADELADAQRRAAVVRATRRISESDLDMSWVVEYEGSSEYNTRTSQFWQAAKEVVATMDPRSTSLSAWSTAIAWTNLYKVAPQDGDNPSDSLCQTQFATSAGLLQLEIEKLRPRVVVFFTGWSWAEPFAKDLGTPIELSRNTKFVEAVGGSSGQRWVIAKHPQGKPRAAFVSEVLEAAGQR